MITSIPYQLSVALREWSAASHCGDHDTGECALCCKLRAVIDKLGLSSVAIRFDGTNDYVDCGAFNLPTLAITMTSEKLRAELDSDPAGLGYVPCYGEVEVLEHAGPADSRGCHSEVPVKTKKVMKIVGNDAKNADLLNRKDGGKSRAETLWGDTVVVTAQDVANAARGR